MMRLGLSQKFALSLLVTTLLWLGVFSATWWAGQRALNAALAQSEQQLRDTARQGLSERAQQLASFLADALTNPVYYFDLLAMREVLRSAQSQPDVRYVIVYDQRGRVIHDGSRDIKQFGVAMTDALASEVIGATGARVHWGSDAVDASAQISIGKLKLGGIRVGLSTERTEAKLAADRAQAQTQLRRHLGQPGSVLVVGLLLLLGWIAVASWLVARGLVRPIRALAARAHDIERGHYALSDAASGRRDELGELIRAFGRMSLGVAQHDQAIRQLAYSDSLTGLPNRLKFRELLGQAIDAVAAQQAGLALLFIDLDDFKRINDTIGHDAGDQVLIEFAARLRQAFSDFTGAHHLARLGGDEFVAVVSGADPRALASAAAGAVLSRLKEPFSIGDKRLHVSASIGLTLYPDDAQSVKLLLKHGDLAMYQAKQHGKGCFRFFAGDLTRIAEERVDLEHALREALAIGQLALEYQPIIALKSGRLVACEALLRWSHPERGMIPPSVFVPVAEASGLMEELGDFVLRRALQQARAWQATIGPVPVAVNISARQFQRGALAPRIAELLAEAELAPGLLHVELTESSLLHNEVHAFAVLKELRDNGVKVWLDDFGTGFSGLSHLRRARVDGVKIDRSFVADILSDPEDLALSSAIIAMAHSLGIEVIAEGVETAAQFELLKQRGCDLAQGYWMSPAVPASALTDAVARDFRPA
jgi:diguanylate cyclase (GGDEF)-like protein